MSHPPSNVPSFPPAVSGVVGRWAGSIKSKERKKELDELNDAWSRDYNQLESSLQHDKDGIARPPGSDDQVAKHLAFVASSLGFQSPSALVAHLRSNPPPLPLPTLVATRASLIADKSTLEQSLSLAYGSHSAALASEQADHRSTIARFAQTENDLRQTQDALKVSREHLQFEKLCVSQWEKKLEAAKHGMDGLHELLSDREEWRQEEVKLKEDLIRAREEVDGLKAELVELRQELGTIQQRRVSQPLQDKTNTPHASPSRSQPSSHSNTIRLTSTPKKEASSGSAPDTITLSPSTHLAILQSKHDTLVARFDELRQKYRAKCEHFARFVTKHLNDYKLVRDDEKKRLARRQERREREARQLNGERVKEQQNDEEGDPDKTLVNGVGGTGREGEDPERKREADEDGVHLSKKRKMGDDDQGEASEKDQAFDKGSRSFSDSIGARPSRSSITSRSSPLVSTHVPVPTAINRPESSPFAEATHFPRSSRTQVASTSPPDQPQLSNRDASSSSALRLPERHVPANAADVHDPSSSNAASSTNPFVVCSSSSSRSVPSSSAHIYTTSFEKRSTSPSNSPPSAKAKPLPPPSKLRHQPFLSTSTSSLKERSSAPASPAAPTSTSTPGMSLSALRATRAAKSNSPANRTTETPSVRRALAASNLAGDELGSVRREYPTPSTLARPQLHARKLSAGSSIATAKAAFFSPAIITLAPRSRLPSQPQQRTIVSSSTSKPPSAASSTSRPINGTEAGSLKPKPLPIKNWLGKHMLEERIIDGDDFEIVVPEGDPLVIGNERPSAVTSGHKRRPKPAISSTPSASSSGLARAAKRPRTSSPAGFDNSPAGPSSPSFASHSSPRSQGDPYRVSTQSQVAEDARLRALRDPTAGMTSEEKSAYLKSLRTKTPAELKEVYAPFKGRGRYGKAAKVNGASAGKGKGKEEFVIDPEKNQGRDFAYHEVVRGAARKEIHGRDCACCSGYHKSVANLPPGVEADAPRWRGSPSPPPTQDSAHNGGVVQIDMDLPGMGRKETKADQERRKNEERHRQHIQKTSRHRDAWVEAKDPPHYFDIGFPSTAKVAKINEEAEAMAEEKRKTIAEEASRENGRYKRR